MIIKNEISEKYWIAYNEDKSIIHYGTTEVGQETASGQPLHEIFDDKELWKEKLIEYGIVVEII